MQSIRLPRILLTNDDGYDAAGLAMLEALATDIADEVWIVAPDEDKSGTAQSLTITAPLRLTQRRAHHFSVNGTPVDCVAMALGHIMKDNLPSVVLSGINAGANVGDEINYSGTVGAAMASVMLGIPAMAISQQCKDRKAMNWDVAKAHLPALLRHFLANGWRKETCLSINLPEVDPESIEDFVWARAAAKTIPAIGIEERTDKRGNTYYWLGIERDYEKIKADDSDVAVLRRGQIAVSSLSLDRSLSLARPPVQLRTVQGDKAA